MRRRAVLGLPLLGATSAVVAACGGGGSGGGASNASGGHDDAVTPKQIAYGDDPSQFGELSRPAGTSRGTVVVIHGGFWRAQYDYTLGQPIAASLAAHGWTAWNLEYRRVGDGGGDPQTFDDVRAGIGKLADLGVDTSVLVTLGHSAGGQLAAWAGGRVDGITHVISQSGVLDLVTADRDDLGGGAVAAFLGHHPTAADKDVDPFQQIPLPIPVWCVHGDEDTIVPISQSRDYVAAAKAAGAQATFVEVHGDHFVVIDPDTAAWRTQLGVLDSIG